ncbi:MAG TPA: hypothetical protein VLQ89_08215 [Candidatus Binatia bacterium]|nr:hypothetical protein [Candidatus Binatia bacterium]
MGLNNFLLPERLPRQVVFAGDRHCEIVVLAKRRIAERRRFPLAAGENDPERWGEIAARLQPLDTGVVLNAEPFIFNFFEFDRLPWSQKLLGELVDWKLQKIFPENIDAYDHRFFRLNRKRVFSILVRKGLLETLEASFRARNIPLIRIGSSTLEILNRAVQLKPVPDFFVETDDASCCLVFQSQRLPVYVRKFKAGSGAETAAEISKTVQFVKNTYGGDPRRYFIVGHQENPRPADIAAELDGEGLSCLNAVAGNTPYIPGSQ